MPRLIDLIADSDQLNITEDELKSIIDGYKTERLNKLPENIRDDSTSVWVSKAKLTEFFEKNVTATGIRLYFGIIDDPFVQHKIHNLVMVSTTTDQLDQVANDNYVIVTKNFSDIKADGEINSLICPPPVERCRGRRF